MRLFPFDAQPHFGFGVVYPDSIRFFGYNDEGEMKGHISNSQAWDDECTMQTMDQEELVSILSDIIVHGETDNEKIENLRHSYKRFQLKKARLADEKAAEGITIPVKKALELLEGMLAAGKDEVSAKYLAQRFCVDAGKTKTQQ